MNEPAETRRVTAGRALEILEHGRIEPVGFLTNASNDTMLVRVAAGDVEAFAVYKPRAGEAPLWDFPAGTLCRREVAAYVVSEMLGFGFVPPTVLRDGPHGVGSLQLFVDHDPNIHYLTMPPELDDVFRRVCAFDLVINNADRKSGHCLLEPGTGRVWVVDHGVSFHEHPKVRTVIWDFAGEPIPADVVASIRGFARRAGGSERLAPLLSDAERSSLAARAERIAGEAVFPHPGPGRPFPWPPV